MTMTPAERAAMLARSLADIDSVGRVLRRRRPPKAGEFRVLALSAGDVNDSGDGVYFAHIVVDPETGRKILTAARAFIAGELELLEVDE